MLYLVLGADFDISGTTLVLSADGNSDINITVTGSTDNILEGTEMFSYAPNSNSVGTLESLFSGLNVSETAVEINITDVESKCNIHQ